MSKNHDGWNIRKKQLETRKETPQFNEGDIWWCHLGHNIGHEQDGKEGKEKKFDRPVLVVKRFSAGMFWGVALTTQRPDFTKPSARFYHQISYDGLKEGKESYVILSQLRVLSSKRLITREGTPSPKQLQIVIDKLKNLLP